MSATVYPSPLRGELSPLDRGSLAVRRALVAVTPSMAVRGAAFCFLGFFLIWQGVRNTQPQLIGDSIEYVIMVEAFYRHGTPDLRPGDSTDSAIERAIAQPSTAPMENVQNFFSTQSGRRYCYHFFFYPLLVVPARFATGWLRLDALKAFSLTNALLLLGGVGVLLFGTRYRTWLAVAGAFLLVWSASLWYVTWPHPEVYASVFVFVSVVDYFHGRLRRATLLAALAAMHNPPLFVLTLFHLAALLRSRTVSLVTAGLCSVWVVVPPLFYYSNFGVPNLIVQQGYLDRAGNNVVRFAGFFLDLDQGMILSLPLILPLFCVLYCWSVRREPRRYEHLLPPVLAAMTLFLMPMSNWNHGQAGINRYAVWSSMIVLAHTIHLLRDVRPRYGAILGEVLVLSQVAVIQEYGGLEVPRNDYLIHKKPARVAIEHFARWYNPDPHIFATRTLGRDVTPEDHVVIYRSSDGGALKTAVREGREERLLEQGWSRRDVARILPKLSYRMGWAYIHPGD